jgi:hypothetical protein
MDKPFLHIYLIVRIKKKTKSKIVDKSFLYNEIGRAIRIQKGGLPKFMVKYIIDDLVKLGLLKLENGNNVYLVMDDPCEKKFKNLIDFC